ncbi:MAG: aldo/keto reductase [Clostridiales Family XIII bacterium]|jgi:predicted aldo/keto reductase-like oxidoreductase|nr:aldo/keto reductase [Clostridiales Family XIII bacterium]
MMKYRHFASAGLDISLLGFGAMRLPTIGGDHAHIDEGEAIRMIRAAIDGGVNYVDTAYVYHGGMSEGVVGKALKDGYREKAYVATKLPYWAMQGPGEMEPALDLSLKRLDIDAIDFYLVHDISGDRWETVKQWGIFEFMARAKQQGKIRHIGFSCHGSSPDYFREVLDAYPWEFAQLQLNFLDKDTQAGVAGYEYAAGKGIPIIVMEPLKGGKLTDSLPESIRRRWDALGGGRTPAEWALRWAANLPGVLTILSGMSTMAQVEENVRVLSDADAGGLSAAELKALDDLAAEYNRLITYACTGCRYCLPCTSGIEIPQVMDFVNNWAMFAQNPKLKNEYRMFLETKASACVACGKCEAECPQHLPIAEAMKQAAGIFE